MIADLCAFWMWIDPIRSDTIRYILFAWILYGFSANQCKMNGLAINIYQRIGFFAIKKRNIEKGAENCVAFRKI